MSYEPVVDNSAFVLIEGCRFPALQIKYTAANNQPGQINISIPYHPSLWPPVFEVTKRPDDSEEIVDDHGITIVNDVNVSGMQPHTRIQVFVTDPYSGEPVWLQEGKIMGGVTLQSSADQAMISFSAMCSGVYPLEIQMFMVDKSRSLGISEGSDWNGELGASSPGDIASRIESAGLGQGIISELKNAGLNSNYFLHILWRQMRYDKRIFVVDNPKALGFFNGSRLSTMFDKTLSKHKNKDSIAKVISYIMGLLRYNSYNLAFPSFIDETQTLPPIPEEAEDATEETPEGIPEENTDVRELMINDLVYSPGLLLAPPPRCNVVFPNQYGQLTQKFLYSGMPTRMIVRATGEGKLSMGDGEAVVMPEDMKQDLLDDKNYNSPEETYRGIVFSSGSMSAPEVMGEMDSDYVKGFYRKAYDESKQGIQVQLGSCPFNPRPVPGLPILILQKDGNHIIGNLDGLSHSFNPNGAATTQYGISGARPYDTPITEHGGDFWYESNLFAPEHIGIYFYPKVLGKYADERHDVEWEDDDMSILALLYNHEMTPEEVKEAKVDPMAMKNASDLLFEEYQNTPNKQEFSRRLGRRSQITFNQLIRDFYGCSISEDQMMATGGYSIATNSISTFSDTMPESTEEDSDAADEGLGIEVEEFPASLVLGDKIPDDAKIRGCYTKERQMAYIEAMQFFIKTKGLPIDGTFMAEALETLSKSELEQKASDLIYSIEPSMVVIEDPMA